MVLILYRKKHVICLKDYRIRSFLSIQYVLGDLCKHLGIESSRSVLESIPKCLHKSPCACLMLKIGLIILSFKQMVCFSIMI